MDSRPAASDSEIGNLESRPSVRPRQIILVRIGGILGSTSSDAVQFASDGDDGKLVQGGLIHLTVASA